MTFAEIKDMKSLLICFCVLGGSLCLNASVEQGLTAAEPSERSATLPLEVTAQQTKLTAADGSASNYFGYSVALSSGGNTAIVGANYEDYRLNAVRGWAYVFTSSGADWSQQAKLTTSNDAAGDYYGSSVTLSGDGDTAIVGASLSNAAYVFTRSGTNWSQQAELTASDGIPGAYFGRSVALSRDGNIAIVGASRTAGAGSTNLYQGAAYVFTRSNTVWSQQAKLFASEQSSWNAFGASVALSGDGDTAIVGANKELYGADRPGEAYVFTRSGAVWTQQAQLIAADDTHSDLFGNSVTLSSDGNTAIVGAPLVMVSAENQGGAAYVFTRSGTNWSQQVKLFPADNAWMDKFGCSVMLSSDGNTAIAGASDVWKGTNAYQGAAYVFTRSGTNWSEQAKLTAADGAAEDYFGYAVALSSNGNITIAGAYKTDVSGKADQGAAYVGAVPTLPTGVAASYDFYVDRVRASWNSNAAATGYEVWRGASNDTGQATKIGTGITVTNSDDTNATAGTAYYYWVKTTNASGASAFSANALGRVLLGPDVRVNAEAGPVTVTAGSQVVVTVSMGLGQNAAVPRDWWLAASTPFGLYYLNSSLAWVPASDLSALQPVYQGPLFSLQSAVALDTTALPAGTYTVYFGIDRVNSSLDQDIIYDSATFTVAP